MEHTALAKLMQERLLHLGEILKYAFGLVNERFSTVLLLTLLVYLPINLALQYAMLQVDISVTDLELLAAELSKVGIVQVILSFFELIAITVTGVCVHNQIFGQEKMAFGTVFYRGVRSWLRAVVSVMILMLGVMMSILSIGMLFMLPGLSLLLLPGIVLLVVFYYLMHCCCCITATLRGYWGLRNTRYVSLVLKGYTWKSLGYAAVIGLVSGGAVSVLNVLLSGMLQYISQQWLALILNAVFSTLFAVLTIYGFSAICLLFFNIEEKKRRDYELKRQRAENQNQL